jgi:hypothetical protein
MKMQDALELTQDPVPHPVANGPKAQIRALIDGQGVSFSSFEGKFAALADAWDEHNSGRSVVDYAHFAHLQIIGMGVPVLPLILARLIDGDGRWVFALKCISGDQADTPSMRGDLDAVINAWAEWGKRNGHI